MIKDILNKIVSALLPDEEQEEVNGPRQRVLDKLKLQFRTEMANETTTESLLYHTSFTVYIREAEYDRLSPSFAFTVRDAVNVFIRELRKKVKKYPNYKYHSKYWVMQLVAISEGSEIEGISAEILAQNPIIISSKLFADNGYDSRIQDDVHCVTTIHTEDSSEQLPDAINLSSLDGLTALDKDKYRVEFNLKDTVNDPPQNEADKTGKKLNIVATLQIADGDFILGDRKYKAYNMTGDKLLVSGKNGSASSITNEIHINDESVLNPTLEIIRDKITGRSLKVWGKVKLLDKTISPGDTVPLRPKSRIMINDRYRIDFTTK